MKLKIGLDWNPTTYHIGFYVSQALGYYSRNGIEIEFVPLRGKDSGGTSAERLVKNEVDIAVISAEDLLYHSVTNQSRITAFASLCQCDTSGIAVIKGRGIEKPSDLHTKIYASYGGPLEIPIAEKLLQTNNHQTKIKLQVVNPPCLTAFQTMLLHEQVDAMWICTPWEGLLAEMKGTRLNIFRGKDFGIPFTFSHILATNKKTIDERSDDLKKFLAVTEEGFRYSVKNPIEAASILMPVIHNETFQDSLFITRSLKQLSPCFFDDNNQWGIIQPSLWNNFCNWLIQHNVIPHIENPNHLFTNELLSPQKSNK